jgi:hypothetical protein
MRMTPESRRSFLGKVRKGATAFAISQLPLEHTLADAADQPAAKTPVGVIFDTESGLTCMSRNGELRFICMYNRGEPDTSFTTPNIMHAAGEKTVITVAAPTLTRVEAMNYYPDRLPRAMVITPVVQGVEPTVRFQMSRFPDSVTAFDGNGNIIGEEREVKDSFRVFLENQIFPRLDPDS